jgi:hypothetical protein
MRPIRAVAAALVTTAVVLGTGWLSRAPYAPAAGDTGMLRMSWRLRAERAQACRPRTPAELAALPVHMRTPEVCDGGLVAYRLVVRIDDGIPDTTRVTPGGARADRPLFVLREAPLPPGPHRLRIRFERERASPADPPPITLDTVLHAAAGRIELITIDPASRRFVHVRPAAP